jgi:hypothetical protein
MAVSYKRIASLIMPKLPVERTVHRLKLSLKAGGQGFRFTEVRILKVLVLSALASGRRSETCN